MKVRLVAACLFLFICIHVQAKKTEMFDPIQRSFDGLPIAIEFLEQSVSGALEKKGWVLESVLKTKNRIEYLCTLSVRQHEVKLRIEATPTMLSLVYIDSKNMAYREKGARRYIHPSYNLWVNSLSEKITQTINLRDESFLFPLEYKISSIGSYHSMPVEAFANYSRFRIEPSFVPANITSDKRAIKKVKNLDFFIKKMSKIPIKKWQSKARNNEIRTLIVKPLIRDVLHTKRRWVYLDLLFIDAENGRVIAAPEFVLSKFDELTIEMLVSKLLVYMKDNYEKVSGGGIIPYMDVRATY